MILIQLPCWRRKPTKWDFLAAGSWVEVEKSLQHLFTGLQMEYAAYQKSGKRKFLKLPSRNPSAPELVVPGFLSGVAPSCFIGILAMGYEL